MASATQGRLIGARLKGVNNVILFGTAAMGDDGITWPEAEAISI